MYSRPINLVETDEGSFVLTSGNNLNNSSTDKTVVAGASTITFSPSAKVNSGSSLNNLNLVTTAAESESANSSPRDGISKSFAVAHGSSVNSTGSPSKAVQQQKVTAKKSLTKLHGSTLSLVQEAAAAADSAGDKQPQSPQETVSGEHLEGYFSPKASQSFNIVLSIALRESLPYQQSIATT